MWQKCPVCKGNGKDPNVDESNASEKCHVCKGRGIIDEATGRPPTDNGSGGGRVLND